MSTMTSRFRFVKPESDEARLDTRLADLARDVPWVDDNARLDARLAALARDVSWAPRPIKECA